MDTVKSYVFLVLTQGTCVLVHWTLNVVSDIESLHLILYIKIGLIGTYKSGWFLKISCTLLHISLLESYDTRARIHLDPLGSTQTCGAMSKLSHQTLSQCLRFLPKMVTIEKKIEYIFPYFGGEGRGSAKVWKFPYFLFNPSLTISFWSPHVMLMRKL